MDWIRGRGDVSKMKNEFREKKRGREMKLKA